MSFAEGYNMVSVQSNLATKLAYPAVTFANGVPNTGPVITVIIGDSSFPLRTTLARSGTACTEGMTATSNMSTVSKKFKTAVWALHKGLEATITRIRDLLQDNNLIGAFNKQACVTHETTEAPGMILFLDATTSLGKNISTLRALHKRHRVAVIDSKLFEDDNSIRDIFNEVSMNMSHCASSAQGMATVSNMITSFEKFSAAIGALYQRLPIVSRQSQDNKSARDILNRLNLSAFIAYSMSLLSNLTTTLERAITTYRTLYKRLGVFAMDNNLLQNNKLSGDIFDGPEMIRGHSITSTNDTPQINAGGGPVWRQAFGSYPSPMSSIAQKVTLCQA